MGVLLFMILTSAPAPRFPAARAAADRRSLDQERAHWQGQLPAIRAEAEAAVKDKVQAGGGRGCVPSKGEGGAAERRGDWGR